MTLVVASIASLLSRLKLVLTIIIILCIAFAWWGNDYFGFATANDIIIVPAAASNRPASGSSGPIIQDLSLRAETVFQGLKSPTSMAFLGQNDILVLEKDNGTVRRIIDGKMLPQPLLRIPVANKDERGMLGIAIAKHRDGHTYVFLYYTESKKLGEDQCSPPLWSCKPGYEPLGNRLYRYELNNSNNTLVNPYLLLNLPASPGPMHNGGKIVIGPDGNVYVGIGEVNLPNTQASNKINGLPPDGSGGILRVTQDGKEVANGPIGDTYPLYLYYAYGIRNTFGMDFDPVTGNLWDTENGPGDGDEVNLVESGFNSGWSIVQGIRLNKGYFGGNITLHPDNLVDFDGKGKYHVPEFTWDRPTVAPTALKFFNSSKLGKQYRNDMFVSTVIPNGDIYHFKLNATRTGLLLNGTLADKVANNLETKQQVVFARNFGGISDLQVGPDGYLYVLSYSHGEIFRIVPAKIVCLHCS
jgi:aldose sugar dehydrogenase